MNTITNLHKLRNIDTKDLAKTMDVSINMAGKYKREPQNYVPDVLQVANVFKKHKIPILFWVEIRKPEYKEILAKSVQKAQV